MSQRNNPKSNTVQLAALRPGLDAGAGRGVAHGGLAGGELGGERGGAVANAAGAAAGLGHSCMGGPAGSATRLTSERAF